MAHKKVLILPPLGEWLLWDANLCQIMSELKQEMERSQSLGYIYGYIEIIVW